MSHNLKYSHGDEEGIKGEKIITTCIHDHINSHIILNIRVEFAPASEFPFRVLNHFLTDIFTLAAVKFTAYPSLMEYQLDFSDLPALLAFVKTHLLAIPMESDETASEVKISFAFEALPPEIPEITVYHHIMHQMEIWGLPLTYDARTGIFQFIFPSEQMYFMFILSMALSHMSMSPALCIEENLESGNQL